MTLVEVVEAYAKLHGYELTPFGRQVIRGEVDIAQPDARAEMDKLIRAATEVTQTLYTSHDVDLVGRVHVVSTTAHVARNDS